jgi:hypothetical protein
MGQDWIDEDEAPDLSTPDYQAKFAAVAVRRGRRQGWWARIKAALKL